MSDFKIENNQFLLNGKPFQIISGSIHYFRVVPEYWEDRLKKLKKMGCNTVETYVAWNVHEPKPGEYCFDGKEDLVRFLRIAQSLDLYAIVRPSPYICAEWEFGGLPAWLLADDNFTLRSKEGPFLSHVKQFYSELLPKLVPYQVNYGGPIILMQIENEYGAYGEDTAYLEKIRDMMREYGVTVPLITSDNFENDISRGSCPGALMTANFGSGTGDKFRMLADKNAGGPLMCTEFWSGWFSAWGDKENHNTNPEEAALTLEQILACGNVNIYMFHGGTNFGFMNGANYYDALAPDVTSYDYDAPLSEDGTITEKYKMFQSVIAKYAPIKKVDIPETCHQSYGECKPDGYAELFSSLEALSQPINRVDPCCMEKLGQNYGYTLYRCQIPNDVQTLEFQNAHDRLHIYRDDECLDILLDKDIQGEHKYFFPANSVLSVLTENLGRVNYGKKMLLQRKGIDGPVLVDGVPLTEWECWTLPLTNIEKLNFSSVNGDKPQGPSFYHFTLNVDRPGDTYIELPGWGKGCVFVNQFNLGRFWDIGPQSKLYLPAPLLKRGKNDIVIFETDGRRGEYIQFT